AGEATSGVGALSLHDALPIFVRADIDRAGEAGDQVAIEIASGGLDTEGDAGGLGADVGVARVGDREVVEPGRRDGDGRRAGLQELGRAVDATPVAGRGLLRHR